MELVLAFLILFYVGNAIHQDVWGNDIDTSAVILKTKNTKVNQLDANLPAQTLEAWLQHYLGAKTKINWELDDCEKEGNEVCTVFRVNLADSGVLVGHIYVGNLEAGIALGPNFYPELYSVYLQYPDRRDYINLAAIPNIAKIAL